MQSQSLPWVTVSGRLLPGSTSGPRHLLNDEEGEELVAFLRRCASVGFSKSWKELLALVQAMAEHKGIEHLVIEGSFIKRHPNITLRALCPCPKLERELLMKK